MAWFASLQLKIHLLLLIAIAVIGMLVITVTSLMTQKNGLYSEREEKLRHLVEQPLRIYP